MLVISVRQNGESLVIFSPCVSQIGLDICRPTACGYHRSHIYFRNFPFISLYRLDINSNKCHEGLKPGLKPMSTVELLSGASISLLKRGKVNGSTLLFK